MSTKTREGNTKFVLQNDSVEVLQGALTAYAQVLRATRQQEKACKIEEIRNTLDVQYYD
jgi:hypothetical protein